MNDEPVAIDVAAVRSFLARRYPDRERGEQAEVSELVEELFAFGWTNLDDLEAMLDQIADKLLEDEKDDLRDRLGCRRGTYESPALRSGQQRLAARSVKSDLGACSIRGNDA